MKIGRLVYRQEQHSIFDEEDLVEMQAVLEIEHEGQTGFVQLNCTYEPRKNTEFYCDVPGVTHDLIVNTDWGWKLDEQAWQQVPKVSTRTPDIDAIIQRLDDRWLRRDGH